MTAEEFWSLRNDTIYEFTFYYGSKKYGILTGNPVSGVLFISFQKIVELNNGKSAQEIGIEINLASISSYRPSNLVATDNQIGSVEIENPPKIKKMIILGAGASYDSQPEVISDDLRPPLANKLFNDRFDSTLINYQGAYNLVSELTYCSDIEDFFQKKWEWVLKNYDSITLSKIINVQYYFHDLFLTLSKQMGSPRLSNYNMLVELAHKYVIRTGEHVVFVSFNYDLLLEKAMMRTLGYSFKSVNDYINHQNRKLLLFKPHGSCNFIRKLDKAILQVLPQEYTVNSVRLLADLFYNRIIGYNIIESNLNDEFELFGYDEILNASDPPELSMYLPQLLLPFKSKDDFVMPKTHALLMNSFLSNIDEIVVIGWKGTEQKFQDLLGQKLMSNEIKITTVTNGDNSVRKEFERSIPKAMYKADIKTFTEYIRYVMTNSIGLFE